MGRTITPFLTFLLFGITLLVLPGCGSRVASEQGSKTSRPAVTFTDAERLSIDTDGDGYVLQIKATFDDANKPFTHQLVPRDAKDSPRGAVRLPVQRIICLSSTHLGFLGEIGALDRVVGVTARVNVASPELLRRIDADEVRQVGEGTQFDVEEALSVRPDLVLAFGVSAQDLEAYESIRRVGVPVLVCADYVEATPLGRAEWIKFFGFLVGKLDEATARYDAIRAAYNARAESARKAEPRPTVLLNAAFQGVWYMPGGDSYMARFLQDAGSTYLWAEDQSSRVLRLQFEAALARGRNADFWLNVGYWTSLAEGKANDERYSLFRAFQTGQVYNHYRPKEPDSGIDFFERGAVRPDLVLADLVKIFHPSLATDHTFVWYEKLAAE